MDTSKFKVAGIEGLISDSLKGTIGTNFAKGHTVEAVEGVSEKTLQAMVDAGTLSSFEVNKVQTKHQSKKLRGRIADFLLWKTFLRRWYFKPFYVQIPLEDHLRMLWEHSGVFEDLSEGDFEDMVDSVSGVMIWEERYPENPYTIILTDISVQPVMPAAHISFNVTV